MTKNVQRYPPSGIGPLRVYHGCVIVLSASVAAISACSDSSPTQTRLAKPTVDALAVSAVPAGLTLRASFTAENASFTAVRVQQLGAGSPRTISSPLGSGEAAVLITDLEPDVRYAIRALAASDRDTAWSAPDTVTMPKLPTDLVGVRLPTGAPPSDSAYTLTSVNRDSADYVVAFDHSGRIGWYRTFATPIGDVQQQRNGHFTAFLNAPTPSQPELGEFVELDPDGEVLREYRAPEGRYLDPHEMVLRPDGAGGTDAYLFMYEVRPADLTGHGGDAYSSSAGHQVVRIDAAGQVHTIVDAWTLFTPADWVALPTSGLADFDHPNALDIAPDGGLLVSWRNLDAVTKHDPITGEVLWQLGGRQSTLALQGDTLGGFSGQHFVRAISPTRILLYDNGTNHVPQETRVAEYEIDTAAHRATLVWQFRHSPPVYTMFTGSAQRLTDGRTFVGYSTGHCTMVDVDGTVQWEGQLVSGNDLIGTYRLLRVPSLVRYEAP